MRRNTWLMELARAMAVVGALGLSSAVIAQEDSDAEVTEKKATQSQNEESSEKDSESDASRSEEERSESSENREEESSDREDQQERQQQRQQRQREQRQREQQQQRQQRSQQDSRSEREDGQQGFERSETRFQDRSSQQRYQDDQRFQDDRRYQQDDQRSGRYSEDRRMTEQRYSQDQRSSSQQQDGAWLGVYLDDNEDGPVVTHVYPQSPAQRAGLRAGDVIVQIDEEDMTDSQEVMSRIEEFDARDRLSLTVLRNGREQEITATLGDRSEVAFSQQQTEQRYSSQQPRFESQQRYSSQQPRYSGPQSYEEQRGYARGSFSGGQQESDSIRRLERMVMELREEVRDLRNQIDNDR